MGANSLSLPPDNVDAVNELARGFESDEDWIPGDRPFVRRINLRFEKA